jgi:hypothetical protein
MILNYYFKPNLVYLRKYLNFYKKIPFYNIFFNAKKKKKKKKTLLYLDKNSY